MKRIVFLTISLMGLWVSAQAEPIPWEAECGSPTIVTIKAEPLQGYKFVQWSDGSTDAEREINVEEQDGQTFIAQFESTTPSGTDHPNAAPRARKVIIGDKLYIMLGDKLYDARGALVQ